jgi:hypothetical protein
MTSRERVKKALAHQEPDRVPIDLGATLVTGIHVSSYIKLRQALGIREGKVKVYEPFQMLAEVEEPVRKALGVDVYGITLPGTLFGYTNERWKPFTLFDGTEVLVSGNMAWEELPNGDLLQFPEGNKAYPPSARMPAGGYYFDVLIRQEPIDEENLDPKEWADQTFGLLSDEELLFLEEKSRWYFENTDYALFGNFGGGSFGDIAIVPGPHIPYPKGVRDPEEWLVSHISRPDYIKDIFGYQVETGLKNLEMYRQAVGDRIEVIEINGNDFGAQNGLYMSVEMYREFYKPYHKQMDDWVHNNTSWKTFFHSCGSNVELFEDYKEAGVDIFNPVQISAKGMEPRFLKETYGDDFVFWGGAVNPQQTLPFGSPDEVRAEVEDNVSVFKKGGGYIFNNVHNIQANIPVENILAIFEGVKKAGVYTGP